MRAQHKIELTPFRIALLPYSLQRLLSPTLQPYLSYIQSKQQRPVSPYVQEASYTRLTTFLQCRLQADLRRYRSSIVSAFYPLGRHQLVRRLSGIQPITFFAQMFASSFILTPTYPRTYRISSTTFTLRRALTKYTIYSRIYQPDCIRGRLIERIAPQLTANTIMPIIGRSYQAQYYTYNQ